MRLMLNSNRKVMECSEQSWARIIEQGNDYKFTVLEADQPISPIAKKVSVSVPPINLKEMPEVTEVQLKRGRKSKEEKPTETPNE